MFLQVRHICKHVTGNVDIRQNKATLINNACPVVCSAAASGHRLSDRVTSMVHMSNASSKSRRVHAATMTHNICAYITERCYAVRKTLGICVLFGKRPMPLKHWTPSSNAHNDRSKVPSSLNFQLPTFWQEHFDLVSFINRFARDTWCFKSLWSSSRFLTDRCSRPRPLFSFLG
jgi:hypothetical protein